jgi:hypothetical protein
MTKARCLLIASLLFVFATWMACSFGGNRMETGELKTESKTVALGGAKSVDVEIKMGAGELKLAGGATDLLNAEFTYNVPRWKPEVNYDVTGDSGHLTVEQPSGGGHGGNTHYEWDLHLGNNVPIEMKVDEGAGQANVNLVGLQISHFEMNMGAGESTVNFDGPWKKDLTASIHGGVGKATLQLPRDTGVHVIAHGGLGAINASGLTKNGDAYMNDAYGKAGVNLNIEVEGGVGEIDLELGSSSGAI